MTESVFVVRISGTNDQGGFDRLEVEGTTVRDSVCWRGQSLCNDLGHRVMPLISPQAPAEIRRLVGEAAAYLSSQGWTGVAFTLSDGRTVVAG